jgi:O-antigen ligase
MKFLALLFILAAIPGFAFLLKSANGYRICCLLVALFPFCLNVLNLDFGLVSWAAWPGYAKGLVITILDSLALAIIITHKRSFAGLPFIGIFSLYWLSALLSVASASVPPAAAFYAFQLMRVFVLFVAAAQLARSKVGLTYLLYGLASVGILEGGVTVFQRLGGEFQATGTMPHQNMLGLMLHFVTLPLFAMALRGGKGKLIPLGVASALIAVALGASRATLGLLPLGMALIAIGSLWRGPTPPKWRALGLGVLVVALATPLALSGIDQRLIASNLNGSDNERAAFERAARLMLADHPLGVGANHYVVAANAEGYSDKAGVVWNAGSRAAQVHNLYLLTAAETGWPGLLAVLMLFAWPVAQGLRLAFKRGEDWQGDLALGITVAILIASIHSLYEWIFITYQVQYVFAIALGCLAQLLRQKLATSDLRRLHSSPNSCTSAP